MIFPPHCKCVGYAGAKPVGDMVYFLSEYLIHEIEGGYEILKVTLGEGTGMMRPVKEVKRIAGYDEVFWYPEKVVLHNRGDLITKSIRSDKRCTIFTGIEEHIIFICDPVPEALLEIHVYDITPPHPHLAGTLKALDQTGVFGELEVSFVYHIRDIRDIGAEVYPCRAAGFTMTIDSNRLSGGEEVAGCLTARQVLSECYGSDFLVTDICPLNTVSASNGPFIARCCRSERVGLQKQDGTFGTAVHWGASPKQMVDAVYELVTAWREK